MFKRGILLIVLLFSSPLAWGEDDIEKDTMSEYIRETLENLRKKMPTGIPEMGMPPLDPLVIPMISEHIKEGIADVQLKIEQLTVVGLKTFNLRKVKLETQTMSLDLGIFLPSVTASAQYDLKGKLASIFPLYGNGTVHFQTADFDLSVSTTLDLSSGKPQMTDLDIKMSVGTIQAMFEGILGGGNLGNLINTVLNMFGKFVFDKHRGDIEKALNGVLKNVVNKELKKVNLGGLGYAPTYDNIHAKANDYIDQVLKNLRPELKKIDPVALPKVREGFEKKVGFIKFKGYIELQTGQLRGVSTLHRAGDVILSINNVTGDTIVDATLGVSRLHVGYNCKAYFMGIKVYPRLDAHVPGVRARAVVSGNLMKGEKQLKSFQILKIEKPVARVRNLSVLGWVATMIVNMSMGSIVKSLKGTLEGVVRDQLANAIANANLPIF